MWPYESVTQILPEEAVKNITDLKLPPLPGSQPFMPAREPNQAVQSHSPEANNSTTSTEKTRNNTASDNNDAKNATISSTNVTSVAPSNSGNNSLDSGANKTVGAKEDKTSSLNSTISNSNGSSTNGKADNKLAKNSNDSKVEQIGNSNSNKTESKTEQPETQNKTEKSAGKGEEKANNTVKVQSETTEPETGVGKLVDPAKPKNESVVPNAETPATLGPKESQKPDKIDAVNKVSEAPLAKLDGNTPVQLPVPNSAPQETVSIKKPEQATNGAKNEPLTVGSGTAQEKPRQEDNNAQQQPVQNTAAAEMQKPVMSDAQAQNTPVPNAQMSPNSPVAVNSPAVKPLTNDQLSQNQPIPSKEMAQSNPVTNEQQGQNRPGPGGSLAQNIPAGNNPVPNPVVQNRPVETGIMQESRPAGNAVVGQNKPLEGGIMQQSRLAENAIPAQNNAVKSPTVVQSKPIENPLLVETKPAESLIVAQNKPAGAAVAQNKPVGSAGVAQGKPAPAKNTAQVNKALEDDLSFDLFGDDTAPVNAPQNPQGQATTGNVKPANSVTSASPQALNAEQMIPSIPENAVGGVGPAAEQNPPLTHEKMIELSSPPIMNIGHTNFATEKDLHLPFKNVKTEGVNRPVKIVNQFVGNAGNQGKLESTAVPVNSKPSMPKVSEKVSPTAASIMKGATPLRPTLAANKRPQTLEEFETERLRKQGLATTMEEGQMKAWPKLSNEGKQPSGQQGGYSPSWEDDYGLLGDATWVRDRAPEAPKSNDKIGNDKEEGKDSKAKEEGKDNKAKEKGKDSKAKEEGKDNKAKEEGKDNKAKEEGKDKKNEEKQKVEKDGKEKKDEKAGAEKGKEEEGNKDKVEKVGKVKNAEEGKGKQEKPEGKAENENSAKKNTTESVDAKTEGKNNQEKSKKEDSSKEDKADDQLKKTKKIDEDKGKDEKKEKEKSENSGKDEKNKSSNETDNVLHSKASYQYIENKTTPLDNFEYHEALGKANETNLNVAKPNKTITEPSPIQAQNIVPDYSKNKTVGALPAAQQNVHPASANPANSQAASGGQQMTSTGDIHQISSAIPISSALPLAALPVANPDHPQFFVSSPVSNQSTTTTTSLLPVDPKTGDHVLNTSLALVAVHGDEGAIPESAFAGTDQVDWMKKYVPSKKTMAGEMKSFVSLQKVPQNIEYSIDDIGKRKSDVRPKSFVPVGEQENIKLNNQNAVKSHENSIKRKRNTFSKLQKALEGTNVTIQNGVNSHMTFKSFVPRLSFDDIVDEQKRSAIPSTSARQARVDAKRSWEKNLGNVIGALEGTNVSIENGVASQMTFKSNIEPVTLIKTKKLQKSLADIDRESRKEEMSHGKKAKQVNSNDGLMKNKGGKASNKLVGKKKPEKVPFKIKKTLEDEKMKEKVSKNETKVKNKRPQNSKSRTKNVKKPARKKSREAANKAKVKRSKTGFSQLHNTIGSHRVPLKGANHSEANLVSTFSGAKNAKESKSVTITNVDKAVVENATNENGTLNVKADEGEKKNGTKEDKGSEKIDQSDNKASKNESAAGLGSSSKDAGEAETNAEDKKNSTTPKAPERGVFEPDIGTMKKMPETTDIKHHIVGSGDASNHTSTAKGSAELILKGNISEHNIIDNNTLHAIYNVRKIDEETSGNTTHLHLKNINNYKINENNTLSVLYNEQALGNKGANSTSKVVAGSLEENHSNKNESMKIAQVEQRAQKKGEIHVSMVQGKALKTSKRKHGTKDKTWRLQKKPTKASKLVKKVPTKSGHHGKVILKDRKGRTGNSVETEKQEIVQSKLQKENTKDVKAKKPVKNAKNVAEKTKKKSNTLKENLKKVTKGSAEGFRSVNPKNDSLDFVQVAIKGNSKKTRQKKLKRIGMIIKEEDRKPGKSKSENAKTASEKKKKLKSKRIEGLNEKEGDTDTKGKKATHEKDKHNQRNKNIKHKQNENKAKGKEEEERNAASEKNKDAKIRNEKTNKLTKNMKLRMEGRIRDEKKHRKKAVEQFNKTLQKIRKITTNPTRNPVEKQKKEKAKKNEKRKGTKKKVQNDEERLKEIQKRKKVRTIFFPQIFMKKDSVPKAPGNNVAMAKVRQLIPTQVGNIEPSNGAVQNAVTGQEQGSKNSDKPSNGKENGNKVEPGSALYESNGTISGATNKSVNNTGDKGSKNSVDAAADIDKVLNLTVGFLNKTFHDHFGKGAHEKDKVNGTSGKVGQNVTNEWNNSKQNELNNGTNGGQNATSASGTSNFESAKNGTNNTSTVTSGPNLAGNTSLQNNTGAANLTMGGLGFNQSEFNQQNLTNQLGNNTSKPSNMSSGFRSERIPGVSKATAVSDMMSPIENYILNMINETGQQRFGNQSIPEGKRGSTSSNETKATGMDGLAALLSNGKGNLNLKSNQVSIKVTPKRNTSSAGKVTDMKAGVGMMLNFASKRSKLYKAKEKRKQDGKLNGKKSDQAKPTKAIKGTKKISSKPTKNSPTTGNRSERKKHKPSAKKTQKNKATKSAIKFATTHRMQMVNTLSKGPVTLGFTKEIASTKKPSKSAKGAKGEVRKDAKVKDKLPTLNVKGATEKENSIQVPKGPKKSTGEEKKDKKKQTKSNRTKRQNEKENSNNDTNNNGTAWQIRIGGKNIDWGPLSENWPNFGSG